MLVSNRQTPKNQVAFGLNLTILEGATKEGAAQIAKGNLAPLGPIMRRLDNLAASDKLPLTWFRRFFPKAQFKEGLEDDFVRAAQRHLAGKSGNQPNVRLDELRFSHIKPMFKRTKTGSAYIGDGLPTRTKIAVLDDSGNVAKTLRHKTMIPITGRDVTTLATGVESAAQQFAGIVDRHLQHLNLSTRALIREVQNNAARK